MPRELVAGRGSRPAGPRPGLAWPRPPCVSVSAGGEPPRRAPSGRAALAASALSSLKLVAGHVALIAA